MRGIYQNIYPLYPLHHCKMLLLLISIISIISSEFANAFPKAQSPKPKACFYQRNQSFSAFISGSNIRIWDLGFREKQNKS